MHGFQLWANLPAALKMTAPCCQEAYEVAVQAGDAGIRFLLVSGGSLREPVAWYGPIVMNTQERLRQAFAELQQGTFLGLAATG